MRRGLFEAEADAAHGVTIRRVVVELRAHILRADIDAARHRRKLVMQGELDATAILITVGMAAIEQERAAIRRDDQPPLRLADVAALAEDEKIWRYKIADAKIAAELVALLMVLFLRTTPMPSAVTTVLRLLFGCQYVNSGPTTIRSATTPSKPTDPPKPNFELWSPSEWAQS